MPWFTVIENTPAGYRGLVRILAVGSDGRDSELVTSDKALAGMGKGTVFQVQVMGGVPMGISSKEFEAIKAKLTPDQQAELAGLTPAQIQAIIAAIMLALQIFFPTPAPAG